MRPSEVRAAIEAYTAPVFQILVGVGAIVGGVYLTNRSLAVEPHDKGLFWTGFALAVGGALVLPGLFQVIRPIYITIFPNGLPLFGGKRAGDPPAG